MTKPSSPTSRSVPPRPRGKGPHPGTVVHSIADALTLKHGDLTLVCLQDGSVPRGDEHGYGLYHHDTRYLCHYELKLGGEKLDAVATAARSGHRGIIQLTNPDLASGADIVPRLSLGVTLTRLLDGEGLRMLDRFELVNHGRVPVTLPFELALGTDFEDLFEIRGLVERRPRKLGHSVWRDGVLSFDYAGEDGLARSARVSLSRPSETQVPAHISYTLTLEPGEVVAFVVALSVGEDVHPAPATPTLDEVAALDGRQDRQVVAWLADRPQLASNAPLLNGLMEQSFRDLHALLSYADGETYFSAGVPWYAALFGRDSLVSGMQLLAFHPEVLASTLRLLARYQGTRDDPWREEAPGRIPHELRRGELARLGAIPHTPYYGSVDATPLFLVAVARHAAWVGTLALFEELAGPIDAALAWIDASLDARGYLAYNQPGDEQEGVRSRNQGWKDSDDAIVHADGRLAQGAIALVEVQGYVYAAWSELAGLFERAGQGERAAALRARAIELAARFNRDFWLAKPGIYALALADGEPCEVASSNPGQALWSGIVADERAQAVVERLMAPDLFGGWGIRTLSTRERRYNPLGYHLGTVWPHDNALIAQGFRRYGFDDEAATLLHGLFDASVHFNLFRVPEVFAGYAREPFGEPVHYPVACHPQAWAAGAQPGNFVTLLGLRPDALDGCLHVVRPRLPGFVDRLSIAGLCIGGSRVNLEFERSAGVVKVKAEVVSGKLEVRLEAP